MHILHRLRLEAEAEAYAWNLLGLKVYYGHGANAPSYRYALVRTEIMKTLLGPSYYWLASNEVEVLTALEEAVKCLEAAPPSPERSFLLDMPRYRS